MFRCAESFNIINYIALPRRDWSAALRLHSLNQLLRAATFYTVGWLLQRVDELTCQSDLSTEQRSIFDFILTE